MFYKIIIPLLLITFSAHSQINDIYINEETSNNNQLFNITKIYALNHQALEYAEEEDTLEAFKCIDDALHYSKNINWLKGLAISNYIKASIKLKYKNYNEALVYFIEAFKQFSEMDDNVGIIITTHYIGKLYYLLGQNEKAKKILNNSIYLAFKNGNYLLLRENIIILANIEYAQNNNVDVVDNLKEYFSGIDTLLSSSIQTRIMC